MLEKILSYLTKFLMKMIFVTRMEWWSSACYKYPQLKSKTKEEICRGTWRSARHFRLPRITPLIFRRCGRPSTLSHVRWCTLDYKPGVTSTKDKSFAIETPRAQGDRDHRPEIPKSPAWLRFSLQRDTPDKFTSRVAPLFTSFVANNSVRLAETAISPSLFAIRGSLFFCCNMEKWKKC